MALDVVNAMRDDGVLISTTGAKEDPLKVRPPLVCRAEQVDIFLASMEHALIKVAGSALSRRDRCFAPYLGRLGCLG
ncbi:hypothetical protein [Mesorhizobium sp. B2-6-4]|uniref:hypothetical protein n=1 Tax=Mesorhizobium sp. B2-6-4 TaxID=2589913 RepID=UPI0032B1006E